MYHSYPKIAGHAQRQADKEFVFTQIIESSKTQ